METLVLIYQSRFERSRGNAAAARAAATAAMDRATDELRKNPFDEILARRALADLGDGDDAVAELSRARALAAQTGNVLQDGIVRLGLADRLWITDRPQAIAHLDAAGARFATARADRWLGRFQARAAASTDAHARQRTRSGGA
jgi:hypothetical protein